MIGKSIVMALVLLAGALAATSPAMAQSTAPTVFRGVNDADVDTKTKARAGHRSVAVVRGDGVMATGIIGPADSGGVQVVAGRRLWFVDFDQETLTNCNLENTIYVGRRVIRCRTRELPDGSLY